jgi:threonine aldolase
MIDLRSDTVTKPTPGMLDAMMSAKVGDDVFGEDPTVLALEAKGAEILGMEAAIYCPSGTMTNQIGIHILSNPYEEVICYSGAHIYRYEGGGVAGTSGLSFRFLDGDRGKLDAAEIEAQINPDDIHYPKTSIIELENTVNKGGGCYYKLEDIKPIKAVADKHNLKMHLDGARLFNAIVETGDAASDYGKYFDTISICLSKGLGAPIGSLLVGSKEWIKKAKRVRKFMGGGMRQVGYIAAGGLYALENNISRLKEDHQRARALGETLNECTFVELVMPVETNIVIFRLYEGLAVTDMLNKLKEKGILAVGFGARDIRLVTHLDFDDDQLERARTILKSM